MKGQNWHEKDWEVKILINDKMYDLIYAKTLARS